MLKYREITGKIIQAAYAVYDYFGFGFLEKVYENALAIELRKMGLKAEQQKPIRVYYQEHLVGEYSADLLVEDRVLVEVKAVKNLSEVHEVQLVNYLKALRIEVGLLINFGEKLEYKRKIFDIE